MGMLPPVAEADAPRGAMGPSGAASATVACGVAAVGAAIVVSLQSGPASWAGPLAHSGDHAGSSALAGAWRALAHALPIGELTMRDDLAAAMAIVGAAAAAATFASRLWRGPARGLAVALAGPLVAVGLAAWAREVGGAAVLAVLPTVALGTIALASAVRGSARARVIAAAFAIASMLLDPLNASAFAGATLFATLASWWRARAGGQMFPGRAGAIAGAAMVSIVAVAIAAELGAESSWPQPTWPALARLQAHVPRVLVYPAIALLVLVVGPLRWRGGGGLTVLAVAASVLEGPGSAPTLVIALAVAATGWVWLAGSVTPRRLPAMALGAGAAISLSALWMYGAADLGRVRTSVAAQRPSGTLVRFYERGLVAPGDVVVVHGARLADALARERTIAGWRPDVAVLVGRELETSPAALLAWASADRRVTSDRFDGGFDWDPQWVIDSGPVFWLAGPGADVERAFTDLARFIPDLQRRTADERLAWEIALLERARFRRALGEPEGALAAMPMASERIEALTMRLQLAVSARPGAGAQSELPAVTGELDARPGALFAAEAGDLLYAHGEHERAGELLVEAAQGGVRSALPALARWQLRTGEDEDGRVTLRAIAADVALRDEALVLARWLIERGRVADARTLAETMPPDPSRAAAEIATRLGVLRAAAAQPAADVASAPDAASAPDEVVHRTE